MPRPLLALVMIVKDEARSIRETLASARPYVDRYTLLDTGSTDGTQALARAAMDGLPGDLVEEPFVDFGTTRSRALDLAGDAAVFTLMLSGDERLVGGGALRRFCEAHRDASGPGHGAYYVRVRFGDAVYDSARLARASAGWRYVGATHEVLARDGEPPPSVRVPEAHIVHDLSRRDPAAQTRRWERDLDLLSAELTRSPGSGRAAFYLAQTLECLGRHEEAFQAYERRAALGGWREEVYESLFRMARTAAALGRPWPEVQQRYLDAHAHSPHRAEPLFAVALRWYEQRCWPLTYLFASRGAAIPFPAQATLFVDAEVYEHKLLDLVATSAFYVGELAAGEAALTKALARRPGDARLLKNLAFYAAAKKR
ncbi:tetratricopeptide repeat-containing glycosyltransferase [Sorangium sp. So ce131]|uniref:tetratricopeptide repeat-containing glycosyltransferase n=1 Tax=Sorangium sp. So ce131 TaxID=3133282 RepID=UPI003F62E556